MSDFYSAIIFLSVFIMIIMDMLVSGNDLMEHDKKQTVYTISVLVSHAWYRNGSAFGWTEPTRRCGRCTSSLRPSSYPQRRSSRCFAAT